MRKMRRPAVGLGLGARDGAGAGATISEEAVEDFFLAGNN